MPLGILRRPEIVGLGHVLYDLRCYVESFPKPDKTSFIRGHLKGNVGGSATNVVCNAAKLGHRGAILGKVGFDEHGQFIIRHLKALGVSVSGLKIDDKHPTGLSLVIVNKDGQPAVVESLGANEHVARQDLALDIIDGCRMVHLTGAPVARLDEVAAYAKARGKKVSFDPGRSISRLGAKALGGVLANTDLLVINRKEAEELGGPQRLTRAFPDKDIVVKGGSRPTILYDRPSRLVAQVGVVPIGKAVDTTGSGDAFAGGLLSRLLEGASLTEAVMFANACGALKALREGADGLPHKPEVEEFFYKNRRLISVAKKGRKDAKVG